MARPEYFDIHGKVALIIGGAGLLGREFVQALAAYGATVIVADVRTQNLQQCPGATETVYVDITSKTSVDTVVEGVVERYKKIDILVNCAARDPKFTGAAVKHHAVPFEDYPLDEWHRALEVNLTGAFLTCQAVGRVMCAQGGGVIVNVASELGLIAPDQRIYVRTDGTRSGYKPADYPVTKAGLIQLTKYLAAYWGDNHIRVNALAPAAVDAGQDDELKQQITYRTMLGRMSRKDEFNAALLFLVSEASSYMTGSVLVADGGRSAW